MRTMVACVMGKGDSQREYSAIKVSHPGIWVRQINLDRLAGQF